MIEKNLQLYKIKNNNGFKYYIVAENIEDAVNDWGLDDYENYNIKKIKLISDNVIITNKCLNKK